MLTLFFLFSMLFLFNCNNLLLSLLLLEILSFFLLAISTYYLSPSLPSDFLFLVLFAIFVMEGVVALSGLISVVSFTGSDYVSSSSFINF